MSPLMVCTFPAPGVISDYRSAQFSLSNEHKGGMKNIIFRRCPDLAATRIGCVARNQKVPGSPPVLCGNMPVVPDWFIKGLVVCYCLWLCAPRRPLRVFLKREGDCLPAPVCCRFIYISDIFRRR